MLPIPPPTQSQLTREEILAKHDHPSSSGATRRPIVYKPIAEIKENSIKSILAYLDFLKPILLQKNDLIYVAMNQYNALQARIRAPDPPLCLESFEVSISNARKFFPSDEPSIERVLQLLSFQKPLVGQYVYFLDVLTVLVIMFRGSLLEKARWLFDWYNVSKTGILTEVEHIILIRRISDCFHRIKAIGVMDVAEEDAAQIALEARVRKTATGQIKFIPGLSFEDFYHWTRDSAESAVLVKFVRVQDKLVDALLALDARVDAVWKIVNEMQQYREKALHVPKMDMFPDIKESNSPLHILYRSHDSVSLCLPAHGVDLILTPEAFIRCDKSRRVPNPLYELPETIQKRKLARGLQTITSGMHMCCEREFVVTTYQRIPLPRDALLAGAPLLRITVTQLDPASHYVFTVYTPALRYPSIGVDTLAIKESSPVTIGILPATLSLSDADDFVKATPILDRARTVVHTGTLCSIDTVIRSAVLFADTDVQGTNPTALADAVVASSHSIYALTWSDAIARLVGMCSAAAGPAAAKLASVYPLHSEKQALYHSGMGPWGNPHVRGQLHDLLGPLFELVATRLEKEYASFVATTAPPKHLWSLGSVSLVFLAPSIDSCHPENEQQGAISVLELTEDILIQALGEDAEAATEEDALDRGNTLQNQLTIVLRSPLDMMEPLPAWIFAAEEETVSPIASPREPVVPVALAMPALSQTAVSPSEDPPPGPRLTGRHELLHGEYSTPSQRSLTSEEIDQIVVPDFNAGVASAPAQGTRTKKSRAPGVHHYSMSRDPLNHLFDAGFEKFIKALFLWLTSSEDGQRNARLVSSGWSRGVNFEIVEPSSSRRIEHICLLPTRAEGKENGGSPAEEHENECEVELLIARIRISLPEGCTFTVLGGSTMRALALQASIASPATLTYLPINKIYDKEIQAVSDEGRELPHVKILDGPRILRVTCNEVQVLAVAMGHGRVRCTLYELPFEVDYGSALALVSAEKDKLRIIGARWQRVSKRLHMLFAFRDLLPYCNYCVVLEPQSDFFPFIAQFRTLYNPTSMMSSVILAAVSEADYSQPSAGVGKIVHLLEGLRPPAAPVHIMHHFTRRLRAAIGIDKPHRADLQHLYHRANVIHTLGLPRQEEAATEKYIRDENPRLDIMATHGEYDSKFSPIHVSCSGKFCRIAPRDGSRRCLRVMAAAISKLEVIHPEIENLLVLVQRPLIRYLQKQTSGKWTGEDHERVHMDTCCEILDTILGWKAHAPGRDCQIVCFAEVSTLQVATIGYRQPSEHYDHLASLGIADKESITEVPLDLMSSSVAYSDRDDASSIASEEGQEQVQHQQSPQNSLHEGGDLQYGLGWDEEKQGTRRSSDLDESQRMESIDGGKNSRPGSPSGSLAQGSLQIGEQGLEDGTVASGESKSHAGHDLLQPSSKVEGSVLQGSQGQSQSQSLLDTSFERPGSKSSWFSLSRPSSKPGSAAGGDSVEAAPSQSSLVGKPTSADDKEKPANKPSGWFSRITQGTEMILHDDNWVDPSTIQPPAPVDEPVVDELAQPSFLDSEAGFTHHSENKHVDPHYFGPNVNIRHLVLPIWEGGPPTVDKNFMVFPSGLNMLGSKIEYFLNRDTSDFSNVNICSLTQNRALYGQVVTASASPETAVYMLDMFIRPGEGNLINSSTTPFEDHPEHSVVGSQVSQEGGSGPVLKKENVGKSRDGEREPPEIAARNRKSYQYHQTLYRSFVHNIDFFEILMGPVIGEVTASTARVLFEFNCAVAVLEFHARPLRRQGAPPIGMDIVVGDDEESVEDAILALTNVQACKVFPCFFEGLAEGRVYQLFIPELCGDRVLGSFRTPPAFTRTAGVIIAGSDCLKNNPMMHAMMDQFYSQQMIEPKYLFREQRILHPAKIASLLSGLPFPSAQENNMWTLIAEQLQAPLSVAHMVIHLDSQSFLTTFLGSLINVLLENGRRLFLPLRDAGALEAYYFNQFEEIIRDTFRLVWSVPLLRESLASGSHSPLFHPDYLVSTRTVPPELLSNESDKKLVAVIRKVYESHFNTYISSLYGWRPEDVHHGRVWRQGPLAVIMLDIVTGRKKLKKSKKEEEVEDVGSPKAKTKKGAEDKKMQAYSAGFLDKEQWRLIRAIAEDELITQIVITTQLPFLPLTDIPVEYIPPPEVPKGECLAWSPTLLDLDQFLMFFVQWLQPRPKRPVISRNIALVSGSFIPYVTTVQDLMTGSKIQQMCVGVFNADAPPHVVPSMDDMQLKGKIGRLRYIHKFSELDHVTVDSSREGSGGGRLDVGMDLKPLLRPNFGVLQMCFDSWKAVGQWSIVTQSASIQQHRDEGDARLLIGPILGPPQVTEAGPDDNLGSMGGTFCFRVGVMIEVNLFSTVTFMVEQAFTGEVQHYTFDCVPLRPVICTLGPLETSCRYNCRIVRGLRESHRTPFVISTHMSETESNFAFINAKLPPGAIPSEDLPKDLLQRVKVPFSGVTCVVHLNSHPDITTELEELRRLPFLPQCLAHCKSLGHLTGDVFGFLDGLMETIRELYRKHLSRPAYRELLQNSFTMFMQTHEIFRRRVRIDEDGDEVSEFNIEESESESVLRFLQLMVNRVNQEYFEQLNQPQANVLRARFKEMDEEVTDEPFDMGNQSQTALDAILADDRYKERMVEELSVDAFSNAHAMEIQRTNPEAHPVKVVFKQWLLDMRHTPSEWRTWTSPNRRCVIELIPAVEMKNLVAILKQFETTPIDKGVRIVVIDGKPDGSGLDKCFRIEAPVEDQPGEVAVLEEGRNGLKLFNQAMKFKGGRNGSAERIDREVCFVCPTDKFGTAKKALPVEVEDDLLRPFGSITTVDSIFRCNAAERAMKMIEVELQIAKETKAREKAQGGKAKTKKIQAQRAEEERLLILESQRQMEKVLEGLVPDGYVFVEARTALITAKSGRSDTLTRCQTRLINSARMDVTEPDSISQILTPGPEAYALAEQDNTPSIVDYVQIPEWLEKFFPSHDGVFVQDDVLLIMRQEPATKGILQQLEDDSIVVKGIELYERSRLSELSRPVDLREVDMTAPGVVSLFLKDLVDRYWEEVVPEDIKPFLVPLHDDFLRAFILSRALSDPQAQLAAADSFARAMQYALVLSVSLKISMDMSLHDPVRYQEIMEMPTEAEVAAKALAEEDQRKKDAHDRAKFAADQAKAELKQKIASRKQAGAPKMTAQEEIDLKKELDALDYNEADVDALVKEQEEKKAAKRDDDSDLEELEEEERYMEEQERLRELEEEAADRLEELREKEEEEAEAAREAAGLNVEEEDEDKEDEEDAALEEAAIFDEELVAVAAAEAAAAEKEAQKMKRPVVEKKKTKAELLLEKQANDEVLMIDALKIALEQVLDLGLGDCIETVNLEHIFQANLDEMMASRPPQTDAERIEESQLLVSRYAKEAVVARRGLGKRLVFLGI